MSSDVLNVFSLTKESEQILDDLENFLSAYVSYGHAKSAKFEFAKVVIAASKFFFILKSTADQWLQKSNMEKLGFY
jgi:hypothetical protein